MPPQWRLTVLTIVVAAMLILGMSQVFPAPGGTKPAAAPSRQPATPLPSDPERGEVIAVPTEPDASYQLLEWRRTSTGHRLAIIRTERASGVWFNRQEFDCATMQVRLLSSGSKLDQVMRASQVGPMMSFARDDVLQYVANHICAL